MDVTSPSPKTTATLTFTILLSPPHKRGVRRFGGDDIQSRNRRTPQERATLRHAHATGRANTGSLLYCLPPFLLSLRLLL
jgi:hypothetical protein